MAASWSENEFFYPEIRTYDTVDFLGRSGAARVIIVFETNRTAKEKTNFKQIDCVRDECACVRTRDCSSL